MDAGWSLACRASRLDDRAVAAGLSVPSAQVSQVLRKQRLLRQVGREGGRRRRPFYSPVVVPWVVHRAVCVILCRCVHRTDLSLRKDRGRRTDHTTEILDTTGNRGALPSRIPIRHELPW